MLRLMIPALAAWTILPAGAFRSDLSVPVGGEVGARAPEVADTSPPVEVSPVARDLPEGAARAFELFRSLEGEWVVESTAGWVGEVRFEVVGAGSAVMSRSQIDPHGEQVMLTVVHPDGARLLLTHYCVAGNQPRMMADEWSEDGRRVVFRFLDGTGLASRDEGHMDAAEYRFVDDDHFVSRWSWSEDGREMWFEEIRYRRTS